MSDLDKENRGPFVLQADGTMSDSELWAVEMDPELEAKFDQYLLIQAVGEAAEAELKIREGKKAFESLMEDFKNY